MFFLKVFVSLFATIIFNIELLSLFKKINAPCIIGLTLIELAAFIFIWFKKNKPVPKINFKSFLIDLKDTVKEDKSFIFLFAAFIVLICASFTIALLSPATEVDAQSYHCLRALFWAHDGFISHFSATDIRCHVMPINSEIFYTFLLVLFKSDIGIGFLEFFSFLTILVSSFKIMELYEIEFKKRIWAILIFSSFAGVIGQISSAQTDLVVGALLSSSLCFMLTYKKENKISDLFFSSLCMAVSFGVKSTGVMASLPLVIYYCYLIRKDIVKYILFLSLNFIIFSSYNYILNFIDYSNPLGNSGAVILHKFWGGYKAIIANFIRYLFQFIDFTGLNLAIFMQDYVLNLQENVLRILHIPTNSGITIERNFLPSKIVEMYSGFGILGLLVFMPAVFICLFKKNLRLFSLLFFGQILVLSFSITYMIFSIRFITTFVALAIPVLSITYFKKMNVYKFIVIFYAIFYMGYSGLCLSNRPLGALIKEYVKIGSIKEIQTNLRDSVYFIKNEYNENLIMKNEVSPLCNNGNKIGVFANEGYRFYSAKYLDLTNDCTIYILNSVRPELTDKMDYVISPVNFAQSTQVFNSNDTGGDYQDIHCMENILVINNGKQGKTGFTCSIKDDFLNKRGFKKKKDIPIKLTSQAANIRMREFEQYALWGRE